MSPHRNHILQSANQPTHRRNDRGRAVASGYFEVTKDVSACTKAAVFRPGTWTDALILFSTVAGHLKKGVTEPVLARPFEY